MPDSSLEISTPRIGPPADWNTGEQARIRANLRREALANRQTEFTARCAAHGLTLFAADSGACLSCIAEPSDLPARIVYLRGYAVAYPATCPTHGETLFSMDRNRCLECYTTSGQQRRTGGRGAGPRAAARRAGDVSYRAHCETHGDAPFHVNSGKCLRCYTATGVRRARRAWD